MPNIATVLKEEISRLARKELRGELSSLKKAASQHRTHIAALRRQVADLERTLKMISRGASVRKPRSVEEEDSQVLRFRPSGLASHRKRLGLSAADFGRLMGVSGQSIYKWESGEVRPRRSQLQAIAVVRKMGRRAALEKLEQTT